MRIVKIAPFAAAFALAACSGEAEPEETQGPAEQGGEVSGEILGGTISDAMLPLDQLQSQSPPLRPAPTQNNDGADEDEEEREAEAPAPPTARQPTQPQPAATAPPLQVAPPVEDGDGA